MSGECEKCGEHCLECSCQIPSTRLFKPLPYKKFAIIGGDIHTLVTKVQLESIREDYFIAWSIEENKDEVWIPIRDEKAAPKKGKWVWTVYGGDQCEMCKRKFFYKKMEG